MRTPSMYNFVPVAKARSGVLVAYFEVLVPSPHENPQISVNRKEHTFPASEGTQQDISVPSALTLVPYSGSRTPFT